MRASRWAEIVRQYMVLVIKISFIAEVDTSQTDTQPLSLYSSTIFAKPRKDFAFYFTYTWKMIGKATSHTNKTIVNQF